MSASARKGRTSKPHGDPAAQKIRSVLVPDDLTPYADRVLGLAALLPLADAATVTLLHVVPDTLTPRRCARR
jgi:nucleotide-binding universal stress UspA family protein